MANITSPIGQALIIATLNEADDPRVSEARAQFWKSRFQAAGDLIRSAMQESGAAGGEVDVDAIIEHLIAPLYLRALVTGAPIDRAFIEGTAMAALHLARCGALERH